ncbi:SDR family NAD(P)-dependent oxidoreductase [Lysobacter arvi]|uniref:SDR family NAD(P)-dependent oxidoreductase n=1 Tax=Lysobacter arvi TaxID=3038776 RepID=A0ABU1CHR9_9GAMM|nr:SDR family oxidoreductase [Lysobacter arvi]MDR0184500.1 SDR family NAD(P)-dependent oxidoreductase [Lysobacter arvi]
MNATAPKASAQNAGPNRRIARAAVVVLGATGGVGRGVVKAALASGRPVIAVARDKAGLQCLRGSFPEADLTIVPGSVSNDGDGERLARALRKLGRPIDGVVAAVCGSASRGRLLDHPAAFLRQTLDDDLLPHLAAARHLLPMLAQGGRTGTYVLIGGPGADRPWAGYGHRSIATAALRMLARVLHEEARTIGVRVQLLAIDSPVCTDLNRANACEQWPSALAVGQRALALIDALTEAGDGLQPAEAVVPYSKVSFWPSQEGAIAADVTPDVDSPSPASTIQQGPGNDAAPVASAPACGAARSQAMHEPSSVGLLPSRCLQDARTLLRNLIAPAHNASHNNNNQEDSP